MTIKEVETRLSASLRMLKGFCYNGRICGAWREINENVIEFKYSDSGEIVRVIVDEIASIEFIHIYDYSSGLRKHKMYRNVILKK